MALSVVDLYRDVLPQTNCGDCGFPTCLALAGMVVSEMHSLENCPHLDRKVIDRCSAELAEQYKEGKWLKKDMADDALKWAKERSASMEIEDLPGRIGGKIRIMEGEAVLDLPYFTSSVLISKKGISPGDAFDLTRWEQVLLYNHMAQGGIRMPTGKWKGLVEFPNTVSKIKSMVNNIETPIIETFRGKGDELKAAAKKIGGVEVPREQSAADLAFRFLPLPRVPVMLMFSDEDEKDGFPAEIKLLFDETITEHLDIESIMFLSERLRQLLCENA